jgi:putative methionine-R-sulfoxide reductase with GAF domain
MSAATASSADGTIISQIRSRFAQAVAVLIMVMPIFSTISQYSSGQDIFAPRQLVITVFIPSVGLLCMALARRGRITQVGMIAAGLMVFVTIVIDVTLVRTLMGVMALIIALALTPRWFYITAGILVQIPPVLQILAIVSQTGFAPNPAALDPIVMVTLFAVVGGIFRFFYAATADSSRAAVESYDRLSSIAAVGQQTSRLLRLEEVLNESVNLIKAQFNFYHVQIFLVDERREYAELAASTGEAGRRLLARNHKLGVGSQSVIGRVTLGNEPVLINDTENEPGHKFNELLPETRAELALPMQMTTGGETRVMGALDVQAEDPNAFTPTDVQALQALANQLAVAIRNAQLFEEQEKSLEENLRLYSDAHGSLEEIQRLNRQLTRQAWDGFTQSHTELTGVSTDGETVTFNAGWTPLMIDACHARDTVTMLEEGVRSVATPIMLRDEVLGAVEVIGGNEEEINLIDAIVAFTERFAVALENIRLVEEALAASAQEQHISAVVSRFQTAETVDELLQITLTELAQTLEADGGSIRVGLSAGGQAAR